MEKRINKYLAFFWRVKKKIIKVILYNRNDEVEQNPEKVEALFILRKCYSIRCEQDSMEQKVGTVQSLKYCFHSFWCNLLQKVCFNLIWEM
jgi:hypothetical protein